MMVGNNLNDVQLQQLVDRTIIKADEDLDGKISFDEFCKVSVCFMRTKCLDGQGPRCNRKANHSMLIQSLLNLISKSDHRGFGVLGHNKDGYFLQSFSVINSVH